MRRNLALLLALCSASSFTARAADDDSVLVVLGSNRPKITLLDSDRGRRVKTIKLDREGTDLEIAADGKHVYVSTKGEARISVVDLTGHDPERSIELGGSGEAQGIATFGAQVAVALAGAGQVVLLDPASGDVKKRIDVNRRGLDRIVIAGQTAYVSDATTGDVVTVDLDRGNVVHTTTTGASAGAVAVDADAGEVWVADRAQGQLRVLVAKRSQVVSTVACPGGPTRIVFGGGRVFALCADSGDIAVVQRGAKTIDRRIPIRVEYGDPSSRSGGFSFDRMVVDPGGKRAFLSGGGERRILTLDLEGLEIRDRFDVDDPVAEVLCIKKVEGVSRKTIKREKLKKKGEPEDPEKKEEGDPPEKKEDGG